MRLLVTFVFSLTALFTQAQNYNISLISQTNAGSNLSALWGYVDKTGREYALVGRTQGGISIYDITDPTPVEVFRSTGPASPWREMKVYNHHAYIVTEGGSGMQIIDLSTLPENKNLAVTSFTENGKFSTAHTLWIDEEGLLWLWGSNRKMQRRGYAVYDLKNNPKAPALLYEGGTLYIHDGLVIGNRMYLSHVNDGFFTIWDVTDKSAPVFLGTQITPLQFTHNSWPSDDGKYLFTTDERENSFLTAYDISDPSNIQEVDRIQTNPGSQAIIHNVHVLNNFAISSYYTEGVTIHDITEPDNIIETGHFDTSPFTGGGFHGAWEAFPYFPSGKIIVSDIEAGLFVLSPVYRRACYLQGTVYDASTGQTLPAATVTVNGPDIIDQSDISGVYKTGYGQPGTYSITFSKPGYISKTVNDVQLATGEKTFLNVALERIPTSIAVTGAAPFSVHENADQEIKVISHEKSMLEVFDLNGSKLMGCEIYPGENNLIGYKELPAGIYLFRAGSAVVKVNKIR